MAIGLIIGFFLGAIVGFCACALCAAAHED
jgi:gas vesicle protein